MKLLLSITALLEGATGLALLTIPMVVVSLLLGVSLTDHSGILLGRIGGAALLSLATACWLSRNHPQSSIILTKALVMYNTSAAILLFYAAQIEKFSGLALWPAIILHAGLLTWCIQSLRNNQK